MKRSFAAILSFVVFVWVLPLGSFIKPSEEKTACGGNRAFHMCTMGPAKVHRDSASQKISFTNASGLEQGPKSQVSGGSDLIVGDPGTDLSEQSTRRIEAVLPVLQRSFLFSIFHPPKQGLSY